MRIQGALGRRWAVALFTGRDAMLVNFALDLRDWTDGEAIPGPTVHTREQLRDHARATVVSGHHQVGTARMGLDAGSVVDPELRVHGIAGLRVADASIMPTLPSGNTNGPSIMIGEKAADLLLGRTEVRA